MSSTAAPPPGRRARRRLARPPEPLERTRWLFFVIALVSLLISLPGALVGASSVEPLLLVLSALALLTSWTHRYLSRAIPVAFDVVDVAAIAFFALASPEPAVAFGV